MKSLVTMLVLVACSAEPVAVTQTEQGLSGGTCMQDFAGRSLTCTANDVRIASASNIRGTDGQPLARCISGTTFSFIADFTVALNATARFDVGLYFATDGDANHDGALTGTCAGTVITPGNSNSFVQLDTAPDSCGDINSAHSPQVITMEVDNVLCQDSDADGRLNLPNCTSWRQPGSNGTCTGITDAFPGSPSKCNCDAAFNIGIQVEIGTLTATKNVTPASRPEPGGEFTFPITATNASSFTSVTVETICDDRYGTVAGTGCPAGTLGTVNATTCTVPQTLAPGASYACSFTGNLLSQDATIDVDTVTFSGHDGSGHPVTASASAQAAVTDVPPTATVTKRVTGLACVDATYEVEVTNTSGFDALALTGLTDSNFGDLFTVHGAVLSTTCASASIAIGTSITCAFTAHFCGGPESDAITATLTDGEGNTVQQVSNALTVTPAVSSSAN